MKSGIGERFHKEVSVMDMKKIGRKMSMLMGVTLSFCMSLIGNITSGNFKVPAFVTSFLVSVVICLIIGFIVPIGKLGKGASGRLGLEEHSLGARCIESLVADLIFTPVMTVAMVSFAYMMAKKHDEAMPYVPALLRSLGIGLVLGFMLAFVLTPVYLKIAMKGAGPDREGSSE